MTTPVERFLTLADASALCSTSVDTVKRRLKAGAVPGARQRPGDARQTWELPISGLLAAGLLSAEEAARALAAGGDPEAAADPVARSRAEQDNRRLREELVELRVRCEELAARLARADDEVTHLRRVTETLAKRSA